MKLFEVVRAMGEFKAPENHDEELMKVITDRFGEEEYHKAILESIFGKPVDFTTSELMGAIDQNQKDFG
jgi:hypothetical protein